MSHPFYRAILSNQLEILFEGLKESLYDQDNNPFKKNLCIVPSPAMKSWISHRFADEEGIYLGLEMRFLNEGLQRLTGKKVNFPHPLELSFKIAKELPPSFQKDRLLIAYELAQEFILFREYSNFKPTVDWQTKIWDYLFPSQHSFLEELGQIDFGKMVLPEAIHLFCISYLTPAKHRLLMHLSRYTSVYTWILTPSRMYWEGRRGAILEEHPLLVSNGKIGREWFSIVDEPTVEMEELFIIAQGIPCEMNDGVIPCPVEKRGLLHHLQADLCLLSQPEKPIFLNDRETIQIHVAPTLAREVEILFHLIKEIFRTNKELEPKDILILIPQIECYLPYLKETVELPLEIGEVVETLEIPLVKSWIQLLELPETRFHLEELFELLESDKIKSNIDSKELFELKKALQAYKVEWGFDNAQRETYIEHPLADQNAQGTLEDGLKKMIASLAIASSEKEFIKSNDEQTFYSHKYSITGFIPLNDFMEWLEKLKQFFRELHPRTLFEWIHYLENSVVEFLNPEIKEDKEAEELILKTLYQLSRFDSAPITYQELLFVIKERFKESAFIVKEKNLNSIKIQTLLPMRAVSSKVVIVMGIDPEQFPDHSGFKSSDERLKKMVPSKRDFDRYLFLETLLSARNQWILTYSSGSSKGHSAVIDDLLRYLDQHYRIDDKPPSEMIVNYHPVVGFDPVRYQPKFATAADYRYLKQITTADNVKAPFFKPPIAVEKLTHPLNQTLSLRELRMAFYHPLRFYMNKALGIYLKKPAAYSNLFEQFEEDEQLSLEFYQWIEWEDFDRLVKLFEAKGYLPKEPFKEVAKERLRVQYEQYQGMLSKLQLKSEDLFTIEFQAGVEKISKKNAKEWILPAPKISYCGQTVEIIGKIPSMSPLGIVTWQKKERRSAVRLIPELLIQSHIPKEMGEQKVCYLKNGISEKVESCDWEVALENFLRLHHQPTPFLPTWIEPLLEKDQSSFKNAIEKSMQASFFDESIDPYLKWASPSIEREHLEIVMREWHEEARRLFR